MKDKSKCSGCYNDIYNHGHGGAKECWSLKRAKLKTKFHIYKDVPVSRKSGYAKFKIPDCFISQNGVFVDKIPEYAK